MSVRQDVKGRPKKRGRGRPKKNGHGRIDVNVGMSPALLAELDAYVRDLRKKAPGVGRGDVISKALHGFGPFRRWRLRGGA